VCIFSLQEISSNDSRVKHITAQTRAKFVLTTNSKLKVKISIETMKLGNLVVVAAFFCVAFAQHDHDHGGDSEECEEAFESFVEFLEGDERRRILSEDHDHDHEHQLEVAICNEAADTFMIEEEGGETFEGNLTDFQFDGCPAKDKCERLICEDGELLIAHFEECCDDVAIDAEPALECEVEHEHEPSKAMSLSANLPLVAALCLLKISVGGQ